MTLPGGSPWDRFPLDRLLSIVAPYWPDADKYRNQPLSLAAQRVFVKKIVVRICEKLRLDPADAFLPHPHPRDLGSGLVVGQVLPAGHPFAYGADEVPTGALVIGSPRSGKTVAVCHLVEEAQKFGIGCLIPDLRGDYRQLALRTPNALYISAEKDRLNPFQPPPGVDLRKWMHVVAARLTWDLGLREASQAYAIGLLAQLVEMSEKRGVLPTLLDFHELLRQQRPRPRSSAEGCWERVLSRVNALVEVCGPDVFAVQRGFPILEEVEKGRLVVLDLRTDKLVSDLLTSLRLYALYYKRLASDNPFEQRTVIVVLDEQRSLIRYQSHEFGIPEIELLFSRSRAVGIGFFVAEQIPSAVSAAVLTACRLKLAFNTSPPELWTVTKLLGLTNEQAAEIVKLPPGQCVARLSGDRIPEPFRLEIPAPLRDVQPTREATLAAVDRSVQELSGRVEPWTPLLQRERVSSPPAPKPEVSAPPQTELPEDVRQVLDRILRFPWETIQERWEALHLDRNREGRSRLHLTTIGLIESAGSIGKFEFFQPTRKGKDWASERGIETDRFKSGTLHQVVLTRVTRNFGQHVAGVTLQRCRPIRGRQPDGFATLPEGRCVAIQVSDTNGPDKEAEALIDIASEPWLDHVVMVVCDKKKIPVIRRELQRLVDSSLFQKTGRNLIEKIAVWDAATVLADGFDWSMFVRSDRPASQTDRPTDRAVSRATELQKTEDEKKLGDSSSA